MKSTCVRVPKLKGESTRKALVEAELLDNRLKVRSDSESVYLPVISGLSGLILEKIDASLSLSECDFEENERAKGLEDILGFSPGFEVIGDIAVVTEEYEPKVGEAIMAVHKNIKTVLVPLTPVSGEFRVRNYRVLCGENRTVTMQREHGYRFEMDLNKVYFSPRLSTERRRVIDQITEMDFVVDMFAGVGPFAIPASKKALFVIAIDKNPDAIDYLNKNIALNKAERIKSINADAREVTLPQEADRAIMNLPHNSFDFLDVAFKMVRAGGIIHYYDIQKEGEIFDGIIRKIREKASACGVLIEVIDKRIVRSYSPHEYNIVLDLRIAGKRDSL